MCGLDILFSSFLSKWHKKRSHFGAPKIFPLVSQIDSLLLDSCPPGFIFIALLSKSDI